MRKQRRERQVFLEDDEQRDAVAVGRALWPKPDATDPHARVGRQQLALRLTEAFATLPEIHQSVLMLREVDGLAYEEIAEVLEIKTGTVMSRLFHARRAMQRALLHMDARERQRLGAWGFGVPEGVAALACN